MISVVVLTKNEEQNIRRCLKSLHFSDDIWIIDSYSTDRTIEIVQKEFGNVSIIENEWLGFADQRNLIKTQNLKYSTILFLDADEELGQDLYDEIVELALKHDEFIGRLFHENSFRGKFLKFTPESKRGQLRLVKGDDWHFVDTGHGQNIISNTKEISLRCGLFHYPFSKGVETWLHKHIDYAFSEVRSDKRMKFFRFIGFKYAYFIYYYILRSGWKDGYNGLLYARMKMHYFQTIKIIYDYNRYSNL